MLPLPRWLTTAYTNLATNFGYLPFRTDEARAVLKDDKTALLLSRLKRSGWLDYLQRETYRVVHPVVCLLELSGWEWRSRVKQRDRLPIVELAVARMVEEIGRDLVSVVLFGSLAKGKAGPGSDIDILMVADGLPDTYDKRLEVVRRVSRLEAIGEWREYLWRERRVYPLLEVIPLSPQDARTTHPFYLDMVEDSIVIYERDGFMERKLDELKARLAELGASKVVLPGGTSYWLLAKNAQEARKLVI